MSNKKNKQHSHIPIEINPFTLASHTTKQIVKSDNNNEKLSDLELQNE
ncbi:26812_t:CDS:1, partial [Gigaspora margarita]